MNPFEMIYFELIPTPGYNEPEPMPRSYESSAIPAVLKILGNSYESGFNVGDNQYNYVLTELESLLGSPHPVTKKFYQMFASKVGR